MAVKSMRVWEAEKEFCSFQLQLVQLGSWWFRIDSGGTMKFTKFRNIKPHTFKYRGMLPPLIFASIHKFIARLRKSCPNDQWALVLIFSLIFLCLHHCIHVFPAWQAQHGLHPTTRILLTLWSTCISSNGSSVEFAFISPQDFVHSELFLLVFVVPRLW